MRSINLIGRCVGRFMHGWVGVDDSNQPEAEGATDATCRMRTWRFEHSWAVLSSSAPNQSRQSQPPAAVNNSTRDMLACFNVLFIPFSLSLRLSPSAPLSPGSSVSAQPLFAKLHTHIWCRFPPRAHAPDVLFGGAAAAAAGRAAAACFSVVLSSAFVKCQSTPSHLF